MRSLLSIVEILGMKLGAHEFHPYYKYWFVRFYLIYMHLSCCLRNKESVIYDQLSSSRMMM
jgi:hypothetical protein